MDKRSLGQTGEKLSVVGFGGILVMDEQPATASRLVAQAIERGISYFDVAPSYGNAEERLGPGGALEAFVEARQRGLVRFLGFSAHTEATALSLLERFAFDTIVFPFNWVCWHQGRFGPHVLEKAREVGVGILALKSLAKRRWRQDEARAWAKCWYAPVESYEEAALGLRFTLSRPITAITSPGHEHLLWWACDAADRLTPLSEQEEALVQQLSVGLDPIFPSHED